METKNLLIFISIFAAHYSSAQKIFNITDYGAVADGQTLNTKKIQNAIDDAVKNGRGIVFIPAGKFATGVIEIKSGVQLNLDAHAILMASTKRIDYGSKNASPLIIANNQHDIGITGKGTIDGQANELLKDIYRMLNAGTLQDSEWKTENPWHQVRPEERNRPKLIEFRNCDGITIKGIFIKDGLCWIENYKNCSNIVVDSIHVESNTFWNNDGIDLVDCKNVRVTNSFFNADDDGICLKSEERNRSCENIYIADCKIRSSASALKFGTASRGGFKNINVRNIQVYDTYRSAIALEAVDGGILEDVDIRNVSATNTGNAIFIRLGHRNKDSVISKIRHIRISNVKVYVPAGKPDKGYTMEGPVAGGKHNVYPSSIAGLPGHPIEDVVLDSFDIVYEGGANKDSAYFNPDTLTRIIENSSGYPEFSMFGELPAWGLFVRHATDVKLKNFRVGSEKEDFRSAMIFDDVDNINMQGITVESGKNAPVLIFNDSKNINLKDLHLPIQSKKAIKYTGQDQ